MAGFEKNTNYNFKDLRLLQAALTHPSARRKGFKHAFERLEFLGDRVLGLVIAEWLYDNYGSEAEGKLAQRLSRLVSKDQCLKIAEYMNLQADIVMNQSDGKLNSSILADALEAIIGAIYLDGGLEPTRRFIKRFWRQDLEVNQPIQRDPKTELQEWSQQRGLGIPSYIVVESSGPDHSPIFVVKVVLKDDSAEGKGPSKRHAERVAASKLLEKLNS